MNRLFILAALLLLLMGFATGAAAQGYDYLLFDTSHDCFWSTEQIESKFSYLIDHLFTNGYEVVVGDDFDNLLDYKVAGFLLSQGQYSAADVALIREYLDGGGSLLVLGEWYEWFIDMAPLNDLLSDLGAGVEIRETSVLDPVNNQNNSDFEVVVSDFSDNCLMSNVEAVVHSGAAPLALENSASALYFSSADSYLLDLPEEGGPFPLAAVANPREHPGWRLIVAGDTSQISDYAIVQMDNDKLFRFECSARDDDDDDDTEGDNQNTDDFAPVDDGELSGGCCGG